MNYIVLNRSPRGLNIFHLIDTAKRHPDHKRQRPSRIKSRAYRAGRRLMAAPVRSVPLPTPPEFDYLYACAERDNQVRWARQQWDAAYEQWAEREEYRR